MSNDRMILMNHKAELNMKHLNAKYPIWEDSKDKLIKLYKKEVADYKAAYNKHDKKAISTIVYHGNNIVSFFMFYVWFSIPKMKIF